MSVRAANDRLVVTMATIPSRIAELGPVLQSIKQQTRKPDRIYVCICEYCEWERSRYDVPEWLTQDDDVRIVVSQKDYGPANKLLGVLNEESAPGTRIVIIDDDWYCNPNLLEELEKGYERYQPSAIGLSGARLPKNWSEIVVRIGPEIRAKSQMPHQMVFVAEPPDAVTVDILQFGFGALVLREWFGDDLYDLIRPQQPLFFADDVLFSGYLESKGINRICLADLPLPRLLDHANSQPLSGDGRMTTAYKAAIPDISSRLGIWPPEERFDVPRPPVLSALRYWAEGSARTTVRTFLDALNRLTGTRR